MQQTLKLPGARSSMLSRWFYRLHIPKPVFVSALFGDVIVHLTVGTLESLLLSAISFTNAAKTSASGCGDGFECGHHVGWFRVERGGAACTLVRVYVSVRLSESQ
jgi:hypothetical protein